MLQKLGILAAMLPVSLCASAYDFVADGIAYTITSFSDLECSVAANDSSYRGDITIPETVSFNGKTLTVKSIGDKAFYQDTALTSVTIPATVTTIGSSVFRECINLKYMDLTNVEAIGTFAFTDCTNLAEVKFGDKLHSIGDDAFWRCGLEEFTIPNSVKEIGNVISGSNVKKMIIADGSEDLECRGNIFRGAPIEYVYIGRSLDYDDYYYDAFYGSTHIKTVEIGEFATHIPDSYAHGFFENCTSLDSIKIQGLLTIPWHFAEGDTALKYVEISNKTTEIKYSAFSGCSSLETIVLGANLQTIYSNDDAFYGCSSLKTIVLKALTPPTYSSGFSSDIYINCRLLIPEGTEALYKNASPWNNFWNLAESPEAGIGEVISENATISVSAENNTIVITGKLAEQIVNVYDIQGRLIATTTQDHVFIKEHGTYIVRIAHSSFKIVL